MNTKEFLHLGVPPGEAMRPATDFISRFVTVILFLATLSLRADQVEMQNGDRYLGTVLSLDTNTLVLRSAVLGTVTLPRGKVALIHLGSGGATNLPSAASAGKPQPAASSIAITNGTTDLSAPQIGRAHV